MNLKLVYFSSINISHCRKKNAVYNIKHNKKIGFFKMKQLVKKLFKKQLISKI